MGSPCDHIHSPLYNDALQLSVKGVITHVPVCVPQRHCSIPTDKVTTHRLHHFRTLTCTQGPIKTVKNPFYPARSHYNLQRTIPEVSVGNTARSQDDTIRRHGICMSCIARQGIHMLCKAFSVVGPPRILQLHNLDEMDLCQMANVQNESILWRSCA